MNKKKILILTNPTDETADAVIKELSKGGEDVVRLHPEDVGTKVLLSATLEGMQLEVPAIGYSGDCSDVKSVWWRRPRLPREIMREGAGRTERDEFSVLINGLYDSLDALWCSLPSAIERSRNKLTQLHVASKLKFQVPSFIVTTQGRVVREFYEAMEQRIIVKPLHSSSWMVSEDDHYSVLKTREVNEEGIALVASTIALPCPLFAQRTIARRYDLRVTAIGRTVTAVAIDTNPSLAIDTRPQWHTAPHRVVEVSEELRSKIRQFLDYYGLTYGAFDFLVDSDGVEWFLECNPVGQFLWMDESAGTRLGAEMARFLSLKD